MIRGSPSLIHLSGLLCTTAAARARTRSARDAGGRTGLNRADAAASASYSSSVRSMSAAATLLSSCSTVAAPGIAATAGSRMTQASATCAGARRVRVGDGAERVEQLRGSVQVLRQEQWVGQLGRTRRAPLAVVSAGQQPVRERAVGDDDAAVRPRVRQQLLLGRAVHEAVGDLVAQHPGAERVLGLAPAVERAVAEADLGDESVVLQVTDARGWPARRRPSARG